MQFNSDLWIGLFGGGTFASIVSSLLSRRVNKAKERSLESEANHYDAVAIGQWIENAERQAKRIGELETKVAQIVAASDETHADMQRQIDLLVERERHQLARVAAHTVWDELVMRKVASLGAEFALPAPPPLLGPPGDDTSH